MRLFPQLRFEKHRAFSRRPVALVHVLRMPSFGPVHFL
jgi:hypothetical protein